MFFWKVVIVLVVIFVVVGFFEKLLQKKFEIPKSEGLFYKPVNRQQKIVERILMGLFLVILLVYMFKMENGDSIHILPIVFLIVNGLYRGYMEWKYDRATKQYILSYYGAAMLFVIFLIFVEGSVINWIIH